MKNMIVGVGKFSRSWNSVKANASTVGGDIDVYNLVQRMARARPHWTFLLVGKHQGGIEEFPDNVKTLWGDSRMDQVRLPEGDVTLDMYRDFVSKWREATDDVRVDAFVGSIGPVGNANSPIPMIGTDWSDGKIANPYVMNVRYCSLLCDFLNTRGIEPTLVTNDPRNWWRPRELWRPFTRPILAQYDFEKATKHEQYEQRGMPWQEGAKWEESVLVSSVKYVYAGLEYAALDDPDSIGCVLDYDRPHSFGVISNENKTEVHETVSRLHQLKSWVLATMPDAPIYGSWTDKSKDVLKRAIEPVPQAWMLRTLQSFRATITFPASGSGWVTAKWAECAAAGTVCFIHPAYDDQNHIFKYSGRKYRQLHNFVRVYTPRQMLERLKRLEDPGVFRDIVAAQRELFEENFAYWQGGAGNVLAALDTEEARFSRGEVGPVLQPAAG